MWPNDDSQGFMKIFYFGIFSAMLAQTAIVGSAKWGYFEAERDQQPDLWKNHVKACGGRQQSPIAINYDDVELPAEDFDAFNFVRFNRTTLGAKLALDNNGHTVVFKPQTDYFVDGGGLYGKYKLAQFHLHWGYEGTRGSEHTLDGVQYAAEIHFVMHSNSYNGLGEALGKLGGIAVLGIFVKEVDGSDNPKFQAVVENLQNITYADDPEIQIRGFNLTDLFPENMDVFYRYKGSLTTPPCTERLTWTVFDEPIRVSKAQMDVFRTQLKHSDRNTSGKNKDKTLADNYRPIQKLYGRTVFISQARPGQEIKKKETRQDTNVVRESETDKKSEITGCNNLAASFKHSSVSLFTVFSFVYYLIHEL